MLSRRFHFMLGCVQSEDDSEDDDDEEEDDSDEEDPDVDMVGDAAQDVSKQVSIGSCVHRPPCLWHTAAVVLDLYVPWSPSCVVTARLPSVPRPV